MIKSKPVVFSEYLRQLPPAVVFEHFVNAVDSKRKIISSSTIDTIARNVSHKDRLCARFQALSPEAQKKCSICYLFGRKGIPANNCAGFKDELLQSFLVYVTRDKNGVLCYRGLDEFEPKLRDICASTLQAYTKKNI